MNKIVIAGCGYIGEKIARRYNKEGAEVHCLVRSPEHARTLNDAGFAASICQLDYIPEQLPCSLESSSLFYLVPPPGGGVADSRARNFIDVMKRGSAPAKIIYMSATSVYGEADGAVVNESSSTNPGSAMGKRRLDAEHAFLEYGESTGTPVVILRVSGIYGPGRVPLMQISHGHPLLREEESGLSNRIYADDLVSVCCAAADKGDGGDLFNVSDGHPSSMTSYFDLCADALGYPRQPRVTLEEAHSVMSPLMLSYLKESKIVDSSHTLSKLGVKLQHPDMTTGVPAACRESNFPPKV